MPLCFGRVGVGAGEQEDVVGEVAGRRPDLLAVDHPFVAVERGPAAEVAEVGSGVRLGVALAPEVLAREILGRKCFFCSSVPQCRIVLPTIWMLNRSLLPPVGTPALCELLGHDDRLELGKAGAAVLRRATTGPGVGCPAGCPATNG